MYPNAHICYSYINLLYLQGVRISIGHRLVVYTYIKTYIISISVENSEVPRLFIDIVHQQMLRGY